MTTDKTIKSKNQPKQTNVTWVDLSGKTPVEKHFINGRWQAIGGGSGSGSDYQSSGSIVKDMIEQGPNFNWAKYAIDIPSLPCFDQDKMAKLLAGHDEELTPVDSLLEEGYALLKVVMNGTSGECAWFVVKVTGETPSATYTFNPEHEQPEAEDFAFADCEPVKVSELEKADVSTTRLIPVRGMEGFLGYGNVVGINYQSIAEGFTSVDTILAFPLLAVVYDPGLV